MRTRDIYLVCFDDGHLHGPFTAFETKEAAQEFVTLAGNHGHVVIGARMVVQPVRSYDYATTQSFTGFSAAALALNHPLQHAYQSNYGPFGIFGRGIF